MHKQKIVRIHGCKNIRLPGRIKIDNYWGFEPRRFTPIQTRLMRRFLSDNKADVSELMTTLAKDNEPADVTLARAYNATILDQQRQIMRLRGHEQFTFCDIDAECDTTCRFRVQLQNEEIPLLVERATRCVSHDLVINHVDHDPENAFPRILEECRLTLNLVAFTARRTDPGWDSSVQEEEDHIHGNMQDVVMMVEDWIAMVPSRPPITHYDFKFAALDVQYKIIHCLLTRGNLLKRALKDGHWQGMEDCFMKVFKQFDQKDLRRLKTDDDGIWLKMFGLVCDWADWEHIFPRLSLARKAIEEGSVLDEKAYRSITPVE